MVRVAITGAAGNVGRQALRALADETVAPLTHSEVEDIESESLDVTDRDAFVDALEGQDVLVHLAGKSSPWADWDAALDVNVDGTYNAYEAARENDLDRVVFASSNHAVGVYNAEDVTDPESAVTDGARTVDPDDPPNPDSYYGVSKVAGEALGSFYAARHGLAVVNLRIGWLMTEEELVETQAEPPDKARFARAMWLSPRDCREVLRRAVLADLPRSPVTVHATSRNDDRFLSLTETATALDYEPRDNATETLEARE
jgi:L-arabinose 1-dehydrogenase [NAD(P)+]